MSQQGGKQPSSEGGQAQQGKAPAESKTATDKNKGPDNPSKHSINEPANKEPHRESGSGRHEPSP